jgi:hypothetical protein
MMHCFSGYGAIPRHGHGINRDTAPSEIGEYNPVINIQINVF